MRIKQPLKISASLRLCGLILVGSITLAAQTVPAPRDTLGFTPGDDRKLASWSQIVEYFTKLDAASDRMQFQQIGKTTMGAPFVYATISSPENLKNLEKYKRFNAELADPRKLHRYEPSIETMRALRIRDGKTIVLITCGIHSTEVGSTLSSMLIAHKLTSSDDPEIQNILKNTIILLVPSLNPDGVDIVKNWYDKTLGTKFEGTEPPELYHKYVGHDNNRDWYAFTQVETQLTVDKIHNVWHPQIVHDIHQQGERGSRLFLPPYMQPVEPNVPKQIVEGYTELGNYMASKLRELGYQGITTNTTYDAWTPARAYSHYHGGVRILSETASAKLATPITVKFEDLRTDGVGGLDAKKESDKFGPVWRGGEWRLRNITDYMTTAAFSLLGHAANNREKWLSRFYEIGKDAVRPAKKGATWGYLINYNENSDKLGEILQRAGVELEFTKKIGKARQNTIIHLAQPYGGFAKALLESQAYPDLRNQKNEPIPPYDVTAHTLPLLMNLNVERLTKPQQTYEEGVSLGLCIESSVYDIALYKSSVPSIDEGWSRWVLEQDLSCNNFEYKSMNDVQVRQLLPDDAPQTIIFPDQSPNQILNGYAKGAMPDEYTGGVGKDGVENLKKFVEAGGTLVFLNRASNFAIEQFNLPIRDVTKGLAKKDFFIPGSILRTEFDTTSPIAKGMPQQSIAWFENGPVFELIPASSPNGRSGSEPPASAGGPRINDQSPSDQQTPSISATIPPAYAGGSDIRIIARYPSDPSKILLSGWALGAEKIAGKAALVEVTLGKGKIILFGFRPQYRGQSLATFPLLFNAISQ